MIVWTIMHEHYGSNQKKPQYQHITEQVTLMNVLMNALLALAKITVGFLGQSHALIADGFHSLSDLLSDALIYLAARWGGQSPDAEHPYGHRRIETLAAILVAVLLLGAGAWIIIDALMHLDQPDPSTPPSLLVLITAIGSILINEGLYQYSAHYGHKIHSQLLLSNAWHNRSDALTSFIVVIAVIGSFFSLQHLDLLGALIIGVIILYTAARLLWQCFRELIDTGVDESTLQKIQDTIRTVPGVVSIHQLRTRSLGGEIFIDVHIQVAPFISVSEGHYIGEHVHLSLTNQMEPISDVTVHIDPEDDAIQHPAAHSINRPKLLKFLKQHWENLPHYESIQNVVIHYHQGQLDLDIYLSEADFDKPLQSQYRSALVDNPPHIRHLRFFKQL